MKIFNLLLKSTIIISLLVSSSEQSYALRPVATKIKKATAQKQFLRIFPISKLEDRRMQQIAEDVLSGIPDECLAMVNEILEIMDDELKEELRKDAAEGLLHTVNVIRIAIEIARGENLTQNRSFMRDLIAAAVLHDIGKYKIGEFDGDKDKHPDNGAKMILEDRYVLLGRAGFKRKNIKSIANAVAEHDGKKGFSSHFSEILYDADNLANPSAHGIEKRLERIEEDMKEKDYLFFNPEIGLKERIARARDQSIKGKRVDGIITLLRSVICYGMEEKYFYTDGAKKLIRNGVFIESAIERIRNIIDTRKDLDESARKSAREAFDNAIIDYIRSSKQELKPLTPELDHKASNSIDKAA